MLQQQQQASIGVSSSSSLLASSCCPQIPNPPELSSVLNARSMSQGLQCVSSWCRNAQKCIQKLSKYRKVERLEVNSLGLARLALAGRGPREADARLQAVDEVADDGDDGEERDDDDEDDEVALHFCGRRLKLWVD